MRLLLLTMVVLTNVLRAGVRSVMHEWEHRIHVKCRTSPYPRSDIKRLEVPDDKVKWSVPWPEYKPPDYSSPSLAGQAWADLDISDQFCPKFNQVDREEHIMRANRVSYMGEYQVVDGRSLNPVGRTGLKGRGVLGRWGPNHAADLILTRWVRDQSNGKKIIHQDSKKPILQFIGIQRNRDNEWAIPGGMVDAGEEPDHAAQREFLEEAMDSENASDQEREKLQGLVMKIFEKGEVLYKGYVDDPRNTDNAWMETLAVNYHAENNEVDNWKFKAGSDAKQVAWLELNASLRLYASHLELVKKVADHHDAHW